MKTTTLRKLQKALRAAEDESMSNTHQFLASEIVGMHQHMVHVNAQVTDLRGEVSLEKNFIFFSFLH